jgi:hypothetical protein
MFLVTRRIWQLMLAGGGQTVWQMLLNAVASLSSCGIARWSYLAAGKLLACLLHRYYSFITLLASLRVTGTPGLAHDGQSSRTVTVGGWCLSFGTRAGIRVPAYLGARVRWLDESGPG